MNIPPDVYRQMVDDAILINADQFTFSRMTVGLIIIEAYKRGYQQAQRDLIEGDSNEEHPSSGL